MTITTLALLLAAAVCHAAWNLLLKQVEEKYIVTWWALVFVSALFSPLIFLITPSPLVVWPYACSSAVFEAAYYITLASAYKDGDFSLVYPLARGAAPAFLLAWSVLFLHESLRVGGLVGVGVILLGLIILGSSNWWQQARHNSSPGGFRASSIGLALMVAFFISCYSAIDGAAVRYTNPFAYTVFIFTLTTLLLTPAMLLRYGWKDIVASGRVQWTSIMFIGVLSLIAYMLVLAAYAQGQVSYAGAVREISIVFAALAGWRWLNEDFGAIRTVGSLLVFCGILIIAVFG